MRQRFLAATAVVVAVLGAATATTAGATPSGPNGSTAAAKSRAARPDPVTAVRAYDLGKEVSVRWTNPGSPFASIAVRYRRGRSAPPGLRAGSHGHLDHAKDSSVTLRHLVAGAHYSVAIWTIAADGSRSVRRTAHFDAPGHGGPKGELEGVVQDRDGNPLRGARVFVGSYYTSDEFRGRTDARGRYRFSVPSGWYYVDVNGSRASGGDADATGYVEADFPQSVRAGTVAGHDVRLRAGAVVRGRVVDEQGHPLAGVDPELLKAPAYVGIEDFYTDLGADELAAAPATGADGRLRLRGVPTGPSLRASTPRSIR